MWEEVNLILARLETLPGGQIKQNLANRKIIAEAVSKVEIGLKKAGYYPAVQKMADTIPALDKANGLYFDFILDSFIPNKGYMYSLQRDAIAQISTYLANEGLEVALKKPLENIMIQNVSTGGGFNAMLAQVRQAILGGEVGGIQAEGLLLRYSKQITRDTLANYASAFQQSIVQDVGLEFYKYVGGHIDRTRDFCLERTGKYFHKREIENWASLSWSGKRKGTTKSSIFIYRGGYNCGHSIVPVDVSVVPKSVVDRAINKGFYAKAA